MTLHHDPALSFQWPWPALGSALRELVTPMCHWKAPSCQSAPQHLSRESVCSWLLTYHCSSLLSQFVVLLRIFWGLGCITAPALPKASSREGAVLLWVISSLGSQLIKHTGGFSPGLSDPAPLCLNSPGQGWLPHPRQQLETRSAFFENMQLYISSLVFYCNRLGMEEESWEFEGLYQRHIFSLKTCDAK